MAFGFREIERGRLGAAGAGAGAGAGGCGCVLYVPSYITLEYNPTIFYHYLLSIKDKQGTQHKKANVRNSQCAI